MKQTAYTRRITIPPLPIRLLRRERLLNRLREGLHTPLTIVQAEFGFGKTTILSQFVSTELDRKESGVAWYTIRENENHLALFLERLGQSIRQVHPEFGARMFLNLRECGDNEAEFREHLEQVFLADVEDIKEQCIIVLDDLHFVDTNEHIFHFLQNVFEELPTHIHLYICTRRGLPLSLDLARMHNEVTEIKRKDLEFTAAEAADFFSTIVQRKLAQPEVDALLKLTQGWTGALALVARTFAENPDAVIEQFSHQELHHALHRLIEEQIFAGLRQPMADALIVANILGSWDFQSVQEILAGEAGRNEIEEVVRTIMSRNEFFLQQAADESGAGTGKWAFNPIFSEYLWTKTTPRHIGMVAESFERREALWPALANFVRAERWADAERVMEAAWYNPRQLPSPHERLQLLERVPLEVQQKAEIFMLERAYLLVQNQEYSQALELTYSRTVGGKFDTDFRIIELLCRIALLGPRDPVLLQQCESLNEDIEKIEEGNKITFLNLYAVVLSSLNQYEKALEIIRGVQLENDFTHYVRARVHAWAGNIHEAADAYEQLKHDITNTSHPWVLAQDYTNATEIALYLGRVDDAKQYNEDLKALTAKYFLRKDGMLADAWGVRIAIASHEYAAACSAPVELVEYFHTKFRPTTADMIVFYRALAFYCIGDYTRAWRELLREPYTHTYEPQRVALKMALAHEMQLASYEKIFSEQASAIANSRETPTLLRVILRQYIAYDLYGKFLKSPQSTKARHSFCDAMRELLGTPHIVETNDAPFAMRMYVAAYSAFPELRDNLTEKFLLTPGSAARAVRAVLRTPPANDEDHAHHAQREALTLLIQQLGEEVSAEVTAPLQESPEPAEPVRAIRVHCLGQFTVEINGQPVEHKLWTTKNQELFLYYLLRHNEDVPDEAVASAVWHMKMQESARTSLMNGAHTLKKVFLGILGNADHGFAIARNRAILGYKLTLGDSYSLDVEEFDIHCRACTRETNRNQPARAAAAGVRALRLCKGDLAMNSPMARATQEIPWLETEREHVRSDYFDVLQFFAEQNDPALFPSDDVRDVIAAIFHFKDITLEQADTLAAFINRAAHFAAMRGDESEADKIQHAYRQMRDAHPALSSVEAD